MLHSHLNACGEFVLQVGNALVLLVAYLLELFLLELEHLVFGAHFLQLLLFYVNLNMCVWLIIN